MRLSSFALMAAAMCLMSAIPSFGLAFAGEPRMNAEDGAVKHGRSPRPQAQLKVALERLQAGKPADAASDKAEHPQAENSTGNSGSQKVEIAIYYEALCPYCRNLLGGSVAQLWNDTEFRKRIDLKLYPFGNAMAIPKENVSDGYKFWHPELSEKGFDYVFACQHGRDECFGNTVSACAIQNLKTPAKYVPFIICMETSDGMASIEKTSFECAAQMNVDMEPIKACANDKTGNKALAEIAQATDALKPPAGPHEYVPWVTVDGEHSQKSEMDGESPGGRLLSEVCIRLEEPKPDLCAYSGATRQASIFFTVAAIVATAVAAWC